MALVNKVENSHTCNVLGSTGMDYSCDVDNGGDHDQNTK